MRKLLTAVPVAVMLLGGCTTNPTTGDIIKDIQNATVLACAFLPTAVTVADILAAGNPAVSTAGAVATAICDAVTPKLGKRRGVPRVGNVVVHGKFVR